nr:MAG TPA: hypothetical protein [Caudoviricetes sp.]
MRKNTLTALLTDLRALILNSRPAYRDFLGEVTETKTTKILENVVLAESRLMLPVADAAFSGFIAGRAYRVMLDGEEKSVVAKDSSEGVILSNVEDISNPPNDAWGLMYDSEAGKMFASTSGAFLGATISVYYDETVTTQKWSVRKLAYELLPDRLLSALSAAANTARRALTAANTAQSIANTAQSTAEAAQSTAEAAQLWGDSTYLPEEKTITISGTGDKHNFGGYHLIPGEVYSPDIESLDPDSWDGTTMRFYDRSISGLCTITWEMSKGLYSVSFKGFTKITLSGKFLPEVSRTQYRTRAKTLPPYVVLPHLLLASTSSRSGKLYKITVDDAGTLSATEVTDTTT